MKIKLLFAFIACITACVTGLSQNTITNDQINYQVNVDSTLWVGNDDNGREEPTFNVGACDGGNFPIGLTNMFNDPTTSCGSDVQCWLWSDYCDGDGCTSAWPNFKVLHVVGSTAIEFTMDIRSWEWDTADEYVCTYTFGDDDVPCHKFFSDDIGVSSIDRNRWYSQDYDALTNCQYKLWYKTAWRYTHGASLSDPLTFGELSYNQLYRHDNSTKQAPINAEPDIGYANNEVYYSFDVPANGASVTIEVMPYFFSPIDPAITVYDPSNATIITNAQGEQTLEDLCEGVYKIKVESLNSMQSDFRLELTASPTAACLENLDYNEVFEDYFDFSFGLPDVPACVVNGTPGYAVANDINVSTIESVINAATFDGTAVVQQDENPNFALFVGFESAALPLQKTLKVFHYTRPLQEVGASERIFKELLNLVLAVDAPLAAVNFALNPNVDVLNGGGTDALIYQITAGGEELVIITPLFIGGIDYNVPKIAQSIIPTYPELVLHDPPGDASFSEFIQGTKFCQEYSQSLLNSDGMNSEVNLKLGFEGDVGFIVTTAYEFSVTLGAGFSVEESETTGESTQRCLEVTNTFMTSDLDNTIGEEADLFICSSRSMSYGVEKEYVLNSGECKIDTIESFAYAIDTLNSTLGIFTEARIMSDINSLQGVLADPITLSVDSARAQNQIDVWEQVLMRNRQNVDNAESVGQDIDIQAAGGVHEHEETVTTTQLTTIEYEIVLENNASINSVAEIAGNGVSGGVEFTFGTTKNMGQQVDNEMSTMIKYTISDDDSADKHVIGLYKDREFGTPVFKLRDWSRTSCPYEGGYPLDQPELTIDDPRNCSNITLKELYLETENLNDPIELPVNICNDSDVARNYKIKILSNTNNANVLLDGEIDASGSKDFFVGPGICKTDDEGNIPNLLVTRNPDSGKDFVYLQFIIYPSCFGLNDTNDEGPEEAEVLTIDIQFGGLNPDGDSDCDGIINEDDLCPLGFDPINPDCNINQNWTYVDKSATEGENDGTSWSNAFTYVQDAIAAAGIGDTIVVAAGTYYPDEGVGYTDNDQSASFIMKNGVVILGGFEGVEPFDFDINSRSIRDNQTILSGDISQTASTTDNSYHIILNVDNGLDNTAILDGFTITKGSAIVSGTSPQGGGGAVFNKNTNPVFRNCHFTANSGELGGAMANHNADPYVINCSFMGNVGSGGGAIAAYLGSYPTVEYCSFSGNSAPAGGQAIRVTSDSYIDISHSVLWGNGSGSGIDNIDILSSSGTIPCDYCIIDTDGGGVHEGIGGANADPLFVNQPAVMLSDVGDLRLSAGSPAIDFLIDPSGPVFDQDGKLRPYGAGHDIGSFERGESCPPSMDLTGTQSSSIDYESGGYIDSDQIIQSPAAVDYNAATEVRLQEGFEVQSGSTFHAFIDGCGAESIIAPPMTHRR